MATPYALLSLEKTTSTQDLAMRYVGRYPILIVAREQTAGRGRQGAQWNNAPEALAASLSFRPDWPTDTWPRLTLIAGVAAARVLGHHVSLKWPNDLVRAQNETNPASGDALKIGGILTEAGGEVVTIGLGVNLLWPEAPEGFGSVFDSELVVPAVALAQNWADELFEIVALGPGAWPVEEYRRRCRTLGRSINWQPDGNGRAVDIDVNGALLVDKEGRRVALTAGAVREVRSDQE